MFQELSDDTWVPHVPPHSSLTTWVDLRTIRYSTPRHGTDIITNPSFIFRIWTYLFRSQTYKKNFTAASRTFRKSQMDSISLRLQTYEDLIKTYLNDSNISTHKESERKGKFFYKLVSKQKRVGKHSAISEMCLNQGPRQLCLNFSIRNVNQLHLTSPLSIIWIQ